MQADSRVEGDDLFVLFLGWTANLDAVLGFALLVTGSSAGTTTGKITTILIFLCMFLTCTLSVCCIVAIFADNIHERANFSLDVSLFRRNIDFTWSDLVSALTVFALEHILSCARALVLTEALHRTSNLFYVFFVFNFLA